MTASPDIYFGGVFPSFRPFPFLPSSPSLLFFPFFLHLEVGPSNPSAKRFRRRTTFNAAARPVLWALNTPSPGRKHIFVYLEPRKRVCACKYRPISVTRNLQIQANMVVSESTACYRAHSLIQFYVIIFTFYFGCGILTPKTPG